jgi:Lar family restriction alleviation protein
MKIKACPFCGDEDVEVERTKMSWGDSHDIYEVVCSSCDIEGPAGRTSEEACERWNSRVVSERGVR